MDAPEPLPPQINNPHKLFTHTTWQECYVDFLRAIYKRRRSRGTIKKYDSYLRRFFADPSKTPNEYTRHDVEKFLSAPTFGTARNDTTPSAATGNNRLTPLQSFYKYAQNYGVEFHGKQVPLFRGINPTAGIVRADTSTERRAFEEGEIALFFAQIPRNTVQGKRDFALFLFYFLTGRRLSEVINVLWGDIKQSARFEDGTRGMAYTWKGKARVGKEKLVELPKEVWCAILDYLEASGRLDQMQPHHAIFVSQKSQWSQKAMHCVTAGKLFLKYARAAGLRSVGDNGELTLHSWRATYGIKSYEENGHDLIKVQTELDHKDINQTADYLKKRRRARANPVSSRIAAKHSL